MTPLGERLSNDLSGIQMKKLLLATAAFAALGAPALAADLGPRGYSRAPVFAAPLYNWTGFYIGGHLGGAFSASNDFNGLVLSDYDARFFGGGPGAPDWPVAR